jgi:hypothetical protein
LEGNSDFPTEMPKAKFITDEYHYFKIVIFGKAHQRPLAWQAGEIKNFWNYK